MTISSTTRKAGPFIGNGSQTAFPFAFKVFAASDLAVVRVVVATGVESTLTLTSDYTVSLNQDQDKTPGGTVTLTSALASGRNLIITSALPVTQPTNITNLGGFYPNVIDDALDRATIQTQQIKDAVDRALRYPLTDAAVSAELPPVGVRKGTLLAFDATTGAPVVGPTAASIQVYAQTYLGALTTNPTTRSSGAALQNGDNYFNTANTQMRVYYNGTWYAMVASVGDASSVAYTPASAVATNVQAKLRQHVSAKDYGAVGDGTTDDTDSLKMALAAGVPIYLPPGEYKITSPLYLDSGSVLVGAGAADTKILKSTDTSGTGTNTARSSTVTDSYVKNAALVVRHGDNAYAENLVVRGIEIASGEDAISGDALVEYGIFAPRLKQSLFADLIIRDCRFGFVTHEAERLVLENVDVDGGTQRGVNSNDFGWGSGSTGIEFKNDGYAAAAGASVSLIGCTVRQVHTALTLYKVDGAYLAGCLVQDVSKIALSMVGGRSSLTGCSFKNVLCDPAALSFESGARASMEACLAEGLQGLAVGTSRGLLVDGSKAVLTNTLLNNFTVAGAAVRAALVGSADLHLLYSSIPGNGSATSYSGSTAYLHEVDGSGVWSTTNSAGTVYTQRSSFSGTKAVLATGSANTGNNTLVDTGVSGLDTKQIMVSVRTDDDSLPTVMAHVVNVSGTSFRVKFSKLTDGTVDTGTFKINWAVMA